jgi:Lon protease-like protein
MTATLPLFPLGTALFPQGKLPLQIFEPRYLKMVRDCQRDNAAFGLVALIQGSEVERAGETEATAPVLQSVGTFARVVDCTSAGTGLLHIQCLGEQRFRITRHEQLPHGLWVAEVEPIEADQQVPIPDDLRHAADKLGRLIQTLQSRGLTEDQMPIEPPFELEDCGWVANRWAELLPLPLTMKQDLLVQESPVLRLELVADILEHAKLAF